MPVPVSKKNAGLVNATAAAATKRAKARDRRWVESFVKGYFQHTPPGDIADEAPDALLDLVLSHLALAATREPGAPNVRLYNQGAARDSGALDHSVIEIVNDDMPFLVDSVMAELNRRELAVELSIHPIFRVLRDKQGRLLRVLDAGEADDAAVAESFMLLRIRQQSPALLDEIAETLNGVLADVRAAVKDWLPMRNQMAAVINEMETLELALPSDEAAEIHDFLRWVHDNHLTFLGYCENRFKKSGRAITVERVKGSGLGVLRGAHPRVLEELGGFTAVSPEVQAFLARKDPLMLTKTNQLSTIHRPVQMDVVGIKIFDAAGNVSGQRLFIGLFTSRAYSGSPREIPLLRGKVQRALARSGLPPASHSAKALQNILETYPRDELFQISEEQLFETAAGILNLQDRQRVALFVRRDDFERFLSCMIFIPRDNYTMRLRIRMTAILEQAFAGQVTSFKTEFGDSALARVHVMFRVTPGKVPAYDAAALETRLAEEARSWDQWLHGALIKGRGEKAGLGLFDRYASAFPTGYMETHDADIAIEDIGKLETALQTGTVAVRLYRRDGAPANHVAFKVYSPGGAIPLSDALPVLEHMGLRVIDEIPHAISVAMGDGPRTVMIHDFGLQPRDGGAVTIDAIRDNFEDTFARVWRGDVESDGFNGLVIGAGLDWRQILVLRTYCKFLRQVGTAFSQAYMESTLGANVAIARLIVQAFETRFDPDRPDAFNRDREAAKLGRRIEKLLDAVSSADEDRILRRYVKLVDATLRTNFYQKAADGGRKPYLSVKISSRDVPDMPLPTPLREIFVYSPRFEGVHLRFGMVARGGLRWSDRPEDFRTEVLGLVKAQQVKNAVIVPVGSKGGFVLKRPPSEGGREAFLAEGIACYRLFISGLLDITDNLNGNKVVPPPNAVRRDADDPYLVVAADKGTATFSDIANGVSADYGFWLGDAFASGGSVGYDHKVMGITARGAWESVKRHFRELGTDIQKQDFTCIGIGDMSGDVFGNGMLLSKHIKLLAAFNHLHILIDPNPDPEKSLAERKRLFALPRSAWTDYDPKVLSKGARIYERAAKTLDLTPEIKAMLGLSQAKITPSDLMRELLKADVDLLWFGGIGTYLKASSESHANVGDRANDAIRIDGTEARAKVIGEGANLGVTQLGRIEYALHGGRLNTDAIDNSAGVDCSDHEVNIKILIDSAVAAGALSAKQRVALLARMTDEVGLLCLIDNYQQSQAISLSQDKGVAALDDQLRLMRQLEREAGLNRKVEFLPDDETVSERESRGQGLTRPEIAVMLSYAKNWLYASLLASNYPDDPYFSRLLVNYFPAELGAQYAKRIAHHRLKREIIATAGTNAMINRAGETFVVRLMEKTGMAPPAIARAHMIAVEVFGLGDIWAGIEALDNAVPAAAQTAMLHQVNNLVDRATVWFLRNGEPGLDVGRHVTTYSADIGQLSDMLGDVLPPHYRDDITARGKSFTAHGVPLALAERVSGLVNLYAACDVVRLAASHKTPVRPAAALYFAVGTRFHMGRLRAAAEGLPSSSHWQRLAVDALIEEIYGHQLALAGKVLAHAGKNLKGADDAIGAWVAANTGIVGQSEQLLSELWTSVVTDISMVAVASRQLRALSS